MWRAVFLNAGPLVHFAHERTAYENSIDSVGKAIIIEDDVIVSISKESDEAIDEYSLHHDDVDAATADLAVHDLAGQSVVPGLMEAATHTCFGRVIAHEKCPGGRQGSPTLKLRPWAVFVQRLKALALRMMRRCSRLATSDYVKTLRTGTTHLEAKSGYGLSTESELRLLQVASRLNGISHTPTIDSTWMGAHDSPPGIPRETYVQTLLSEQLPAVVEQGIARSADRVL